ncbi:MAG TPA: carboxypeptidase-like regulatory domain-containing protein [Candidatus Polarisedimenticolia bacterium]|nr:carboxypeptidase-like regulatory domain-containing protein [Candidatus Polarisedimenticolia bacterium]
MRTADGAPVRRQPPWSPARVTIERLAFSLIILLAGWVVCARQGLAQNLQPDNQANIVRGIVVNAVTHEPIGRALVYSPDNRYAMLSDGEGHFEFTLPKAAADHGGVSFATGNSGKLTFLMARKPGFLDDPHGTRSVEVLPGAELTIALMPEALITGRVTLPAAEPARGVDVQLFALQVQDGSPGWMQKNSARTNSNGEFRFAELEPGIYKVLTREWMDNDPEATTPGGQLYGFPPVYYPSATDFVSASTIQLTAGQTFQGDFALVRQPYYPVKIPVTNMGQDGGMNVTVLPQGQRGPGYSLGYNRGRDVIEGQLPNGKYLVEAAIYMPDSKTGSVNLAVAGAPVEGPAMVLARNNSISVNVKEEFNTADGHSSGSWSDGKHTYARHGPRLDLQIGVVAADDFGPQRSGSIRETAGANDDSLVLENIAPGRYWLRLRASRGYVASATMGGTDLLREPLVVVPGANATIEITMRDDNAELEGTLIGVPATSAGSGRSSPQGFVYCIPLPESSGVFLEIPASFEGRFDYRMVAPGVYRVIAFGSHQPDIPYRDAEAMKAYETKGQIVHFAAGQKVTLQLQVISGSE